jgi:hypothetical protein
MILLPAPLPPNVSGSGLGDNLQRSPAPPEGRASTL